MKFPCRFGYPPSRTSPFLLFASLNTTFGSIHSPTGSTVTETPPTSPVIVALASSGSNHGFKVNANRQSQSNSIPSLDDGFASLSRMIGVTSSFVLLSAALGRLRKASHPILGLGSTSPGRKGWICSSFPITTGFHSTSDPAPNFALSEDSPISCSWKICSEILSRDSVRPPASAPTEPHARGETKRSILRTRACLWDLDRLDFWRRSARSRMVEGGEGAENRDSNRSTGVSQHSRHQQMTRKVDSLVHTIVIQFRSGLSQSSDPSSQNAGRCCLGHRFTAMTGQCHRLCFVNNVLNFTNLGLRKSFCLRQCDRFSLVRAAQERLSAALGHE